ncbi:MAG: hypothetical protein HY362_01195 [Candidatus Aenigmarchaeota archaeon]|nr:hypothetical protein [Candidatus Aenigmarchaeota archaeon]
MARRREHSRKRGGKGNLLIEMYLAIFFAVISISALSHGFQVSEGTSGFVTAGEETVLTVDMGGEGLTEGSSVLQASKESSVGVLTAGDSVIELGDTFEGNLPSAETGTTIAGGTAAIAGTGVRWLSIQQSSSIPKEGEGVDIAVDWVSDSELDYADITITDTETYTEKIDLSGKKARARYTWSAGSPGGTNVQWSMKAYDIAGKSNTTGPQGFEVGGVDTEKPKILKAEGVYEIGSRTGILKVKLSDNLLLAKLNVEINGKKKEPILLDGKSKDITVDINPNEFVGGKADWKLTVEDGAGLVSEASTGTLKMEIDVKTTGKGIDYFSMGIAAGVVAIALAGVGIWRYWKKKKGASVVQAGKPSVPVNAGK